MLVRFAYLAVTHAFAALRLLPMTDRDAALRGGIRPVSKLSADATNNAEPSLAVGRVDRIVC
jgi:hypothetical protein